MRWSGDPLWAGIYDWSVEHRTLGGLGWRLVAGSDLRLLYDAAREVGDQPAGAVVVDVPVGGGVALHGLRPGQGVDYVAVDISEAMLERTRRQAERLGVADQVRAMPADVEALPFDDGSVDLVVTFTGLHCFPDPRQAVAEMTRVLRPGGVLTGSALLNDTGLRYAGLRTGGRVAGLVGPSATSTELVAWLEQDGLVDVDLRVCGAIGYVRGVKA